jgi:hypothetical protein
MAWYLDNTRVFVQEHKRNGTQIIPRIQPLTGGTVHQYFGYESPILNFSALIVGEADRTDIESMYYDHSAHTLSGPYGIVDYYVHSQSISLEDASYQTIRPDLDCEAPVYTVAMELYEVT